MPGAGEERGGYDAVTNPESRIANPGSTATIAAVATAAGSGGIGIVRISGPQALHIGEALTGRAMRPRYAHRASFLDAAGIAIDHGLALAFPAPNSYTGEHVVEVQAHGSAPVLAALMARVIALGAQPARPGEFTERAYLNGKLDLTQAEAVADLIAASSAAAARAALRALDGVFSTRVEALRADMVRLRVQIEAAIDFPEEELELLAAPTLAREFADLRAAHAALMSEAQRGQRLRDGLHAVIIGPPNAGKSSLLNALAGSERAIVTAIPGTTRDLLRESLRIDGVELTLVDTAGLRTHSDDPVEIEGMRRARAELAGADLVLAVMEDGDEAARGVLISELAASPKVIWLHNKIDRSGQSARRAQHADGLHLWLSAASGDGLPNLIQALTELGGGESPEGSFTARARHVDALTRVGACLDQANTQLTTGHPDLVAEDLRLAHHILGEITGAVRSDDLLGEIFSSFCIGK